MKTARTRRLPAILIGGKSKRKADTTRAVDTLANFVNVYDGSGGYTQLSLTCSQMEGGRIHYVPILIDKTLGWE